MSRGGPGRNGQGRLWRAPGKPSSSGAQARAARTASLLAPATLPASSARAGPAPEGPRRSPGGSALAPPLTGGAAQGGARAGAAQPCAWGLPAGAAPAGRAQPGWGCALPRALAEWGIMGLLEKEGAESLSRAYGVQGVRTRPKRLFYHRSSQP